MVPNYLKNIVCVVVGFLCAAGYGGELPDLVARLEKLDGKDLIHAAVHIEDRISGTQEKESKPLEKADLIITADANSLTLTISGELSNGRILREFSLLRAAGLAHYGPALVRELAGLELVGTRPDSRQGIPCTRWHLKSEEKQSKFGMSSTTRRDVELWIDADGYPVAASFKTQNQGKVLLFKFSSESARQQRYERLGGRLILVLDKNETDVKSKAGDQKRTFTTTVEVKKD
ncbi:MAG: hypothetical protein PVJ86_00955 [Phycisphaerales bacterium]